MGRVAVWAMNKSHAPLAEWGLAQVPIERDWTILDVGCGGGMAIHKMARMLPAGKVCGVDFSEENVRQARRTNKDLLQVGRVEIREGVVSSLPYPDGSFDLVVAIDSHYYWPDLPSDLHEVNRVLRPGGKVAIVGEGYRGGVFGRFYQAWMKELKVTALTAQAISEVLSGAGFSDTREHSEDTSNWICVVAAKP